MKTAVFISGQARSFAHCFANQRWMLYRHLGDITFYVSVADDEDADCLKVLEQCGTLHFQKIKQPDIPEPWGPFGPLHPSWGCAYSIQNPLAGGVQSILKQFWHLNHVHTFALSKGFNPHDFSLAVRTRADLWFHEFDPSWPIFVLPNQVQTPFWGNYGGCNDRFALCAPEAVETYLTTFTAIDAMLAAGCPLHPETMLKFRLQSEKIRVLPTLRASFAIVRKPELVDGRARITIVPPEPTYSEIATLLAS